MKRFVWMLSALTCVLPLGVEAMRRMPNKKGASQVAQLSEKDVEVPKKPIIPELPPYKAKDFSHLIGMPGFDDELLKTHFTLYRGYVKNTNLLISLLRSYQEDNQQRDYPFQAIQRRFAWEFDGMRLHELYFGNLGGTERINRDSALYKMIQRDFGTFNQWKENFIATGLMRGIGWSVLYFDPKADRLFNVWINEHATGHLAGGDPILVLDVWEHAYITQYGLDRDAYIQAFFRNINWDEVSDRFQKSVTRR